MKDKELNQNQPSPASSEGTSEGTNKEYRVPSGCTQVGGLVLVDSERLSKLIDKLPLDKPEGAKDYIKARWLHQVLWWDCRADKARKSYTRLRWAVVIGSAVIPSLLALSKVVTKLNTLFTILSIVVSSIVAVCAAIESFGGFGDVWREKRDICELIKSEGFSFFQLSNGYSKWQCHKDAYPLFVSKVEELIRGEVKEYLSMAYRKDGEDQASPRSVAAAFRNRPGQSRLGASRSR
jgi:Protein of unknown function (DUF4231)